MGGQSNRRDAVKAAALGLLVGTSRSLRAQSTPRNAALTPVDEKTATAVRSKATKAGLGALDVKTTEHFLGIGNGPADYSQRALDLEEKIGRDFLAHFRKRGFKLDYPAGRLAVVTLKDGASYRAFSGDDPGEADGGRYYPEDNWLVIFDFRADQAKAIGEAKRTNTFTLAHETIHLLCYNTGLLARDAEVPGCISEGLATYGETWTERSRPAFGGVERFRLLALSQELAKGRSWIPISRLLKDDDPVTDPETYQLAYAEAWLLVHYLMETPERLPKFRAYLAGLPKLETKAAKDHLKTAGSHLGSIEDLDTAVRRHAQRMARKAGLSVPAGLSRARG
jgi:hypothetical protein